MYNIQEYTLRRSRDGFREHLKADASKTAELYAFALDQLDVLRRQGAFFSFFSFFFSCFSFFLRHRSLWSHRVFLSVVTVAQLYPGEHTVVEGNQ